MKSLVKKHVFYPIALLLLFVFSINKSLAATADAMERAAVQSNLGSTSVLLGAAYAGVPLFTVGERGLILRSSDNGKTWQQVPSPVSVTLTDISFSDENNGYAIGHSGIILATKNGGESWEIKLNGVKLAKQLLIEAESDGDEHAIREMQRLVDDGPDKPFFDLLQLGPKHVVAVGAYGLAIETKDGGETWQSWMGRIENFFGYHLYAIKKQGDHILIAGEQGFIALSMDNGQTFSTIESPYEGSFFTAELLPNNDLIVAGLRGNAFVSHDNGASWNTIMNPIPASITGSTVSKDGQVFMSNQAGMILSLSNDKLFPITHKPYPPLTHLIETSKGNILALSISGSIPVHIGNSK
ncbi:hypothetical protein GV054_11050 [Marinomonas mediterranea]|uniref:WD40/YVTN/BNR-like repeat-containing protein n=1 Tax=Marinomonas mediterranea TaxID=119864 RepID=UPI00234B6042|nr:YCF48-related protein [Marinomonas mediterranea]WCN13505.1 hypothetical protein GV054_11050 [Marinomonas mediterranea]